MLGLFCTGHIFQMILDKKPPPCFTIAGAPVAAEGSPVPASNRHVGGEWSKWDNISDAAAEAVKRTVQTMPWSEMTYPGKMHKSLHWQAGGWNSGIPHQLQSLPPWLHAADPLLLSRRQSSRL